MSSRESWVTAGQLLGMLPSECSLCEWLTILLYTLEATYHPLLAFQVVSPTRCVGKDCWCVPDFIVGVLSLGCQVWLQSRIGLWDQEYRPPPPPAPWPIKAMDLEAHWGFPGQRHSAHVPIVQCWEKSILVWPRTRKVLEARDKPLWTPPVAYLFPVAFVLYPLL